MDYMIICGPVGSGEKTAVEKIKESLGNKKVAHIDVERELCKSQKVRDKLSAASGQRVSSKQLIRMRDITESLPRKVVNDLWAEQLRFCLDELSTMPGEIKLLSCHLMLYGHVRGEFYSPIDVSAFLNISPLGSETACSSGSHDQLRPAKVLLLMDDVYDMFLRLSAKTQLYEPGALEDELQQSWLRAGNEGEENFPPLERDFREFKWKLSRLTQLLNWRHAEAVMAESLARQLRVRFSAMSVKQLSQMAANWLSNPQSQVVYLSHPIRQSRRYQAKSGNWDPFVNTFNQFQFRMLQHNISCVMPTGIDELRFESKDSPTSSRLVIGALGDRWPAPSSGISSAENNTYSPLMYSSPEGHTDFNQKDFFGEAGQRLDRAEGTEEGLAATTLLRFFIDQIGEHIAARDHLLVAHADALLVYRPLHNDDGFAGGVLEEIQHWYKREAHPRIAFVHSVEDVTTLLQKNQEDMLRTALREVSKTAVINYPPINLIDAQQICEDIYEKKNRSLLRGASQRAIEIKKDFPSLFERAKQDFAWYQLTRSYSNPPKNDVSLWIVEDEEETWLALPEISRFLETGNPVPSTSWTNKIDKIIQRLNTQDIFNTAN